jgi:hypothetical protein
VRRRGVRTVVPVVGALGRGSERDEDCRDKEVAVEVEVEADGEGGTTGAA